MTILIISFPHSLEDDNTNLLPSREFFPNLSVAQVQPVLRFVWTP